MDVGDQDGLRFDATKLHTIFDDYGIATVLKSTPARTQRGRGSIPEPRAAFFSKNLCFTADCR